MGKGAGGRTVMLGFNRWYLYAVFAAMLCIAAIVCVALSYFIPVAPTTVTLATGFTGSSFEAFGLRYQEILARSHVELTLRKTSGALENLKLLQDPDSGVAAALVTGGISNGKEVPGFIFGVLDRTKDAENLPALNAWKIDEKNAKFVKMPTEGLLCSKSGIYTVDGGL